MSDLTRMDWRSGLGHVPPNVWTDWRDARAHLACSFWLADCLHLMAWDEDARRLLERLLKLRHTLGLLAEEYDSAAGRQSGTFPQAFSHVALLNAVLNVTGHPKTSETRGPTMRLSEAVAHCRDRSRRWN